MTDRVIFIIWYLTYSILIYFMIMTVSDEYALFDDKIDSCDGCTIGSQMMTDCINKHDPGFPCHPKKM